MTPTYYCLFRYSIKLMEEVADKLGQEQINRVYCFGDNPLSDIYGANLFTKTLAKAREDGNTSVTNVASLQECISILVGTGVWNPNDPEPDSVEVDYGHRDLPFNPNLCKASVITDDVLSGIKYVFKNENISENGKPRCSSDSS